MKLSLEQRLEAPPELVWPFLVEPEKMNRWSFARIELLAAGDGGAAGGVGAMRRIHIRTMGRTIAFDEVVEASEAPRGFVYRVFRGLPIRDHRGEIRLAREGAGSRLTWDVDFSFLAPGMGLGARGVLKRQLGGSLRALADVVREEASAPRRDRGEDLGKDDRPVDADVDVRPLWAHADEILLAQRALADRLAAIDDPKWWFTRVYEYVTEGQLSFCGSGQPRHVAWILRLIPIFHRYYTDNLFAALGEGDAPLEAHWRSAFRAMDRASRLKPIGQEGSVVAWGVLRGARAHIEEDLPRALADVYLKHYAGVCDFARLRADYVRMAGIFRDASKRLIDQMPRHYLPRGVRELYPVVPETLKESFFRRVYYDVPRARLKAFERGERLAAWRRAG